MRDTLRKLGGVALGVPEPVAIETTVTLPRPGRQASTSPAPTKVFDADAVIRRFDDIPTVNRDQVPFAKVRLAKGTKPAMSVQPVRAEVEAERPRPRCVLPQEVDVRYVLEAMRRAR